MNGSWSKSCNACFVLALFMLLPSLSTASNVDLDPWESMNRKIHGFNDVFDKYLLKPVATGYDKVLPDVVQNRVSNFYFNLTEINTVVNDLLQGKFKQAGNDTGRFLVNTTVGLVGMFDVAKHIGLPKSDSEDFGQTLAVWGWSNSRYLVLPFLGPNTLSAIGGMPLDSMMNPISYVDHVPTRNTLTGVNIIKSRASILEVEGLMTKGDRYVFIRDGYMQRREYLINDGVVEDTFGNNDDEFGDEF